MAAGVEDEGAVRVLTGGDGQAAIGSFVFAPLGEVDVEVGFGGYLEEVPVFSVARRLLDPSPRRSKLGVDVAIEARREAWRGRRFELKELNRPAVRFRMMRVMKPYLESVLS
jgi:hypothetical protein